MPEPANVRSIDAIEAFKAALLKFTERTEQGLTMIDSEMNRLADWMDQDRPRFWKQQVRLAGDEVVRARAELQRCLMYPVANERPSCREERAALKKAEARLAYCEEKLERLTHWRRELQRARFEYEGRISQLNEVVDIDAPQAVAVLQKILRRLEDYQAVKSRASSAGPSAAAILKDIWPDPPSTIGGRPAKATDDNQDAQPKEPDSSDTRDKRKKNDAKVRP